MTGGLLGATTTKVASGTAESHREAGRAAGADAAQAAMQSRAEPAPPLRVLSVSPGSSAESVTARDPVRVLFSAALAPGSPQPVFSPPVAGRWRAAGRRALVFTPAVPPVPATRLTLRIPGGPAGVRSVTGSALARPVTAMFQAGGWSTIRLQRLLAQLGYLPLTWVPHLGSGIRGPADGGFRWRGRYPAALTTQWQPGAPGVILTGAIMAFQAGHGLPMTGTVTGGLWGAVLTAAAHGRGKPGGYTYALVSKALPETLTVWRDGRVVFRGLANTGAPATPTPDGTFPVYLRRPFQVMRGLMPDGAPYADPAHFVSFFHGDYAVHSLKRPSYGSPQSLGCVELPLRAAARVWPYLSYGTLVTIGG